MIAKALGNVARKLPRSCKVAVCVAGVCRALKLGSLSFPRWMRILAGGAKALGTQLAVAPG